MFENAKTEESFAYYSSFVSSWGVLCDEIGKKY